MKNLRSQILELPENYSPSKEVTKIIEKIESSEDHIFITGKAGSGKSTLLNYFRTITKKKIAVLAPTGVAAIRIRGQTIHSFFKFPPKVIQTNHIKKLYNNDVVKNLETLIIDEISMVRADVFDAIDYSLRINKKKLTKPFGGVQLVVIGDLFQLPPVINNDEQYILRQRYPDGSFFFQSNIFLDTIFHTYELHEIYRQKQKGFIEVLNNIRTGELSSNDLEILNEQVGKNIKMEEGKIILTGTNVQSQKFNKHFLDQVDEEPFSFKAISDGQFHEEIFPTDGELILKKGAQIMMIKNDPEKRWVNGSIGKIHSIALKKIQVKIDGRIFEVKKEKWERIQYHFDEEHNEITEESIGSFQQYPMRLAYAVTIHKSQGQTFDRVVIDLTRAFAHGQLYVALSRCTSLEGIQLVRPITEKDIIVDPQILRFTRNH